MQTPTCNVFYPIPFDTIMATSTANKMLRFGHHHKEYHMHSIKMWAYDNLSIPVLIGPSIPHRDNPDVLERYCHLMLIFFKPWRHPAKLLQSAPSWQVGYTLMLASDQFLYHHLQTINNMQLLHECKDSRDRDYKKRRCSQTTNLPPLSDAIVTASDSTVDPGLDYDRDQNQPHDPSLNGLPQRLKSLACSLQRAK
jgi:hypothetical protein